MNPLIFSGLSKQQIRVLKLTGDALNTKEIAMKMKLSHKSVEYHRSKLYQIFPKFQSPIKLARLAIASGLSSLCLMCMAAGAQQPFLVVSNPAPVVQLAWNPSTASGVTNYTVYFGVGSGQYTNKTLVGSITNAAITLPARGVTFYFAATATAGGLESLFSNEVNYTPPNPPAPPTQKPLTVLTVMKSTAPDGVFADAGMSWSDVPSDTASFYRLKIDRGVMPSLAQPPVPK